MKSLLIFKLMSVMSVPLVDNTPLLEINGNCCVGALHPPAQHAAAGGGAGVGKDGGGRSIFEPERIALNPQPREGASTLDAAMDGGKLQASVASRPMFVYRGAA